MQSPKEPHLQRTCEDSVNLPELNKSRSFPTKWLLPLLLLLASVALIVRINDLGYIEESLSYEDGTIFLTQAYNLGLLSLVTPYAGYLLLYQRIVALCASVATLSVTPYVYVLAWALAFFSIVWALHLRHRAAGLDYFTTTLLVFAVALQPTHGEIFFSLNHAHFMLGLALALLICIPSKERISAPERVFLILASLTGPFSVVMTSVLFVQLVALRDFAARKFTYVAVPACALVQVLILIASHRLHDAVEGAGSGGIARDAILAFILFGKDDIFMRIVACAFWAITLLFLIKSVVNRVRRSDRTLWLSPIFAAGTAILLFLAGGFTLSALFGYALSPLDIGSRYFFIPYSLAFFIALSCTRDYGRSQIAAVSLLSMICAAAFLPVDRADRAGRTGLLSHANMQWVAFTKLQMIQPETLIPINAPLPLYPPLHVRLTDTRARRSKAVGADDSISITPRHERTASTADILEKTQSISAEARSPVFYFDIKGRCPANRYLAIELDVWRERMGWATLYWGHSGDLDSKRSLKRFYPSGEATMQFAFRRKVSEDLLRLDPANGVPDSAVLLSLQSLKRILPPATTIGKPTDPGGEVRIKGVRLFCLE